MVVLGDPCIPGVESATLAQYTPFTDNWGELVVRQGKGTPNVSDDSANASWDHVGPGYLEAMGQTIVRGRSITGQQPICLSNARLSVNPMARLQSGVVITIRWCI